MPCINALFSLISIEDMLLTGLKKSDTVARSITLLLKHGNPRKGRGVSRRSTTKTVIKKYCHLTICLTLMVCTGFTKIC